MKSRYRLIAAAAAIGLAIAATSAQAGPFIISGTDSDDHGAATVSTNLTGWLYMQKAIENLAPNVTNGFTNIVTLGTDASTQAGDAAASAFGKSSISGTWTFTMINGVAALTNYFAGIGSVNINNTGLVLIDSGDNVVGGISAAEDAVLTANAVVINSYVGGGGGLFAQASDLGWLSALIPGIIITDIGTGGDGSTLLLTPAGSAAFPGLTNADLSSGPWHHYFNNYAPLNLLAELSDNFDVIIGAAGGSITNPDLIATPEPSTLALLISGLLGLGLLRRRSGTKMLAT